MSVSQGADTLAFEAGRRKEQLADTLSLAHSLQTPAAQQVVDERPVC